MGGVGPLQAIANTVPFDKNSLITVPSVWVNCWTETEVGKIAGAVLVLVLPPLFSRSAEGVSCWVLACNWVWSAEMLDVLPPSVAKAGTGVMTTAKASAIVVPVVLVVL